MLMQNQKWVSPQRALPVDFINTTASATAVSGETVQLYYNNSGTLTADAGQAAGTIVIGKLANLNVLDKLGQSIGRFGDSSLSFTSTALTTEIGLAFEEFEKADALNWPQRMAVIGSNLSNGQYVVDYRLGVIYGKKTTTTTLLASTAYSIPMAASKLTAAYNSSAPTYTSGNSGALQMDVNGNLNVDERYAPQAEDNTNAVIAQAIKPLATSTYSWTKFQNLAANTTLNVKASAGNVRSLVCMNANAAVRYVQLHNTATTPAGGAAPVFSFIMPATSGMVVIGADFFGDNGANFATGIAFAVSTTRDTYTAATAADHSTFIQYA